MARLAAYYQEDFHSPSAGYGHKQRKSTYLVYEEPRHLQYSHQLLNGNRLRNLAASDPSLSPHHIMTPRSDMTLKQRPIFYGSQMLDSSSSSIPQMTDFCSPRGIHRHEMDRLDNESILSYCDSPYQVNPMSQRQQFADRSRKRFSYAEPSDCSPNSPDAYMEGLHPQSFLFESDLRNFNHKMLPNDNFFLSSPDRTCLQRPESRQSSRWHWQTPQNAFSNATYLSPPSPLDSGLSSQSITSSPSLEAEPMCFRGDVYQPRTRRHSGCSCPKMSPVHTREQLPNLTMCPPAGYITRPSSAVPMNKHRPPQLNRRLSYSGDDFDQVIPLSQARYGKMGIMGEVSDSEQTSTPTHKNHKNLDNRRRREFSPPPVSYIYTDHNGVPLRKAQRRKSHKSVPNYNHPCLIIIETPEKSACNDGPSSPGQEASDKSQGPESPMSVTASNSDSPSVSSSNNELDVEEHTGHRTATKSSDKKVEQNIRELEAMYEKCDLSDRDLLDRAERRDLPTVHQMRRDRGRLTRSNSDTLYEAMSPTFHNPYEAPRRAPPNRRAGIPDRIADDMAMRKLRKPVSTSSFNLAENTISYMLCSTHFTPTVPSRHDLLSMDSPDVELDDLSYRKHYFGKKSKIMDPQPPFGIPLQPPPPQKIFNDYLHVVPSGGPQPLCHPRGNPDVVRDDLAFRALRKDEPERMYYDISQIYRKQGLR